MYQERLRKIISKSSFFSIPFYFYEPKGIQVVQNVIHLDNDEFFPLYSKKLTFFFKYIKKNNIKFAELRKIITKVKIKEKVNKSYTYK